MQLQTKLFGPWPSIAVIVISTISASISCPEGSGNLPDLPGFGWDGPSEKKLKQVFAITYNQCKLTKDGIWNLPDGVAEKPIENNWQIRITMTDPANFTNPNEDPSANPLDGTFTDEYRVMKRNRMINGKITKRIHLRKVTYQLEISKKTPLHQEFKMKILQIATAIKKRNSDIAAQLARGVVSNYGTRVITRISIGAAIIQEGYLPPSKMDEDYREIKQSFADIIRKNFFSSRLDGNPGIELNSYEGNRILWTTRVKGSPLLTKVPSFASEEELTTWFEKTTQNPIAVQQFGIALQEVLTPTEFPTIKPETLPEIQTALITAIEEYYVKNTHPGCGDPNYPNFKYSSNTKSDCSGSAMSFYGVYKNCTKRSGPVDICTEDLSAINPLTDTYGCPSGYEAIPITSGTIKKITYVSQNRPCGKTERNCRRSQIMPVTNTATISTYWCGSRDRTDSYYFGGIINSRSFNPVTRSSECSENHKVIGTFGLGDNDLTICGSNESQSGYQNSVLFGGFLPCFALKLECPAYYKYFFAGTTANGCKLYYCIQGVPLGSTEDEPFLRPPYGTEDALQEDYQVDYDMQEATSTTSEDTSTSTSTTSEDTSTSTSTTSEDTSTSTSTTSEDPSTSTSTTSEDPSTSTSTTSADYTVGDDFASVYDNESDNDFLANLNRANIHVKHATDNVDRKESIDFLFVFLCVCTTVATVVFILGVVLLVSCWKFSSYGRNKRGSVEFPLNTLNSTVSIDAQKY